MVITKQKQERFDNLKIGQRVMTPQGTGVTLSFTKNGIGQNAITVKYPCGKILGAYTAPDVVVLGN